MITEREKKGKFYIAVFAVLFAAVFALSFIIGKYPISPGELLRVFFGKLSRQRICGWNKHQAALCP